jgi:hypothetical protein
MKSQTRATYELLALARTGGPPPAEPDCCPHCGSTDLSDPSEDQYGSLLGLSEDTLRRMVLTLGRPHFAKPVPGVPGRLSWCPSCECLVLAGDFDPAWGPLLHARPALTGAEVPAGLLRWYTDYMKLRIAQLHACGYLTDETIVTEGLRWT